MNESANENMNKQLNNTGVIILGLDRQENISYCNKKIQCITGLSSSEMTGKNWLDVLLFANGSIKKDMFRAVMADTITNKREKNFQGSILDSQGKERLILWNLSPTEDEDSQINGSMLIGHDVTETKSEEFSLKKIDETLKTIFSCIKEYALYVANLDGNITYFGMGAETMLGWNKDDIIFKHLNVMHNFYDKSISLNFVLENVKKFGHYETEAELVTKVNETIPVILTIYQFLDSAGKHSGYIFIAKDITERRRLEYQVFQGAKLAALGQLSAGIAHEINNPLFVISGRLEMLKEERLSQKVSSSLDLISGQTDRIRKLVERILKFSRKTPAVFEPLITNDIIDLVLPLIYYNNLTMSKIEIKKNFQKDMPKIKGDLLQLQEVFLNLLINACQSMPSGGIVEITTTNFQNLYAQIEISDTGTGIDPLHQKNIFMPFFSTKNEGTGLGLSICHNIIKNHNGSIELKSQVNQGTVFTIKLPFD